MDFKITKIEIQKKNLDRVNIYINEEYYFSCHKELVFKLNLKVGSNVDLNVVNKAIIEDDFIKCKNYALKIIDKTSKTSKQIKLKLIQKGFSEESILKTINFLCEYKFIDDEKYTELYINQNIKRWGKNKIKYSLITKGIDEEIINEYLRKLDKEDEIEIGKNLALKKYISIVKTEKDRNKINRKLYSYLISKGYSFEYAKNIVDEITSTKVYDEINE